MSGLVLTERQLEARRRIRAGVRNDAVRYFLMYGGTRSGKTLLWVSEMVIRAVIAPESRHLIVRRDAVNAKQSVGMDTLRRVWKLQFPALAEAHPFDENFLKTDGLFRLPKVKGYEQSEIWISGLNDRQIDRVLGREYATVGENEVSEISYSGHETVAGRLAQNAWVVDTRTGRKLRKLAQRLFADMNPTTAQHWAYKLFIEKVSPITGEKLDDAELYDYIQMNPVDNTQNLDEAFLRSLNSMSEAKRRRFRDGNFMTDVDGSLWKRSWFRRAPRDLPPMKRIVVALDPATTNNPGSDESGIIVAGISDQNAAYVLRDASEKLSPIEWARRGLALYREFEADAIVCEVNNGGDMIPAMIRAAESEARHGAKPGQEVLPARVIEVRATRGKVVRAEPVTALYEQGVVYHVDGLDLLEDQMCQVTIDFDRDLAGWSPDRMDALVWAITELMSKITKKPPRAPREPIAVEAPFGGAAGWMTN